MDESYGMLKEYLRLTRISSRLGKQLFNSIHYNTQFALTKNRNNCKALF